MCRLMGICSFFPAFSPLQRAHPLRGPLIAILDTAIYRLITQIPKKLYKIKMPQGWLQHQLRDGLHTGRGNMEFVCNTPRKASPVRSRWAPPLLLPQRSDSRSRAVRPSYPGYRKQTGCPPSGRPAGQSPPVGRIYVMTAFLPRMAGEGQAVSSAQAGRERWGWKEAR